MYKFENRRFEQNGDPLASPRVEFKSTGKHLPHFQELQFHTAIAGYPFKEELEPLGGSTILADSGDGHPAVVKHTAGMGNVVLMGSFRFPRGGATIELGRLIRAEQPAILSLMMEQLCRCQAGNAPGCSSQF